MTAAITAREETKREARTRRTLTVGAVLLVLGLAVVGSGSTDGAAIALTGLIVTIYGIHTFGRLGPEGDAESPEPAATTAGDDGERPRPRRTRAKRAKRKAEET